MRLHEQTVSLDRIDSDDATYQITTRSGIEDLTASITRLGILHAPLLHPRGNGWTIIAGFRRIAACRATGLSEVPAKVLPADTAEHRRVELAIADNSLQRPLNLIETARSLQLLSGCHATTVALAAVAADLNLPDNPDLLQKLLRLATLSESIQNAVLDQVVALSMALTLGDLDAPLADEWVRIFRDLNAGLNRQRELLTLVAEIAIREDRTAAAVLLEPDIRKILSAPDADPARKYRLLATCLRSRRYPRITRAEQQFDDLARALALGPNACLTPPAQFEGTTYRLQLSFSRIEDLQAHRQTIEMLIRHPELRAFLKQ